MALIDKDIVLNSNPTKRLIVAFENMKMNYNESSAKDYMETYKDQPLAFIIENSRYIFSEPMYGLKFYTEYVLSNSYAFMFTEYENEKEKIELYLEENGNKMPEAQKNMYEDLLSFITEKYNESINVSTIISHACEDESVKNEYDTLVESVYELQDNPEKMENIKSFIESTNSADLFYAVSPFLVQFDQSEINYSISSNINRFFSECTIEDGYIDETEWKNYIESVIIVSKLYNDTIYKESVSTMRRKNSIIFEGLASESVKSQIDELSIEHVTESTGLNKFNTNTTFDCYYSTPCNAVNRIFEDDDTYDMMREENEKFKMERTNLKEIAMNVLFEYVMHEYKTCDNLDLPIIGYNYFEEGTSIKSSFDELLESPFIIREEGKDDEDTDDTIDNEDEDTDDTIDDEDEDNVNTDDKNTNNKNANNTDTAVNVNAPKNKNKANNIQNKAMNKNTNNKNANNTDTTVNVTAPKNKNIANNIQNKAMDKEAKFLKKKAVKQQKNLNTKNAIKAVTAVPQNIINSIKQTISNWDKTDDDKRKEYIVKPGYRKKLFRNLKLAIMYGSAASVSASLVPVVYISRSFSKKKDMRIRNELARELETELKICEEKIADATAKGDEKEKYALMRIKSDLEKEVLRVKTNSKYV